MRILLIRQDDFLSSGQTNITGIYPPLGLAYIASALRNATFKVSILDNRILRLKAPALKKQISAVSPDMVLLSCMTPEWQQVVSLGKIIKEVSTKIIVGAGGPHFSIYPNESLSAGSLDFGVYGEGEETIVEIAGRIQKKEALDGVRGCIFRKNGAIIINPPRRQIEDLDKIPFPAIDLLPFKKYFALSVRQPFFSVVTSRGCPYSCSFCFQGYLGNYRARSPENVTQEMEQLTAKFKIREIIIFDETFAAETKRAVEICDLIIKKRLKFSWDIRTRIDLINPDLLGSLRAAGCRRLHLGIESGNQEVLDSMRKGITIQKIKDNVSLAKKFGFQLRGYFMLAFPGEKYGEMRQTVAFAKSLALDWASFTVTIGLPGTSIYNEALKNGYFPRDYWRELTLGNKLVSKPYFIPEGANEKDLLALKRNAYREFYLRPKIIKNILKNSAACGPGDFRVFFESLPSICRSIRGV